MINNNLLKRKQLQNTLDQFHPIIDLQKPQKGWIRAIREVLGMSRSQLAKRMRVSRQRIFYIEEGELSGRITLNQLDKVADSLDCIFAYCLIPRKSLEETIRKQAKLLAERLFKEVSHTMNLENQSINKNENDELISEVINNIINNTPNDLWDY
ncbi:MAG: mobile mystery protein A [Candidatus Cloacimonadales bacterium]|nr:mobile mystery protein A [Candidatus Cloacimonadales bacterium]